MGVRRSGHLDHQMGHLSQLATRHTPNHDMEAGPLNLPGPPSTSYRRFSGVLQRSSREIPFGGLSVDIFFPKGRMRLLKEMREAERGVLRFGTIPVFPCGLWQTFCAESSPTPCPRDLGRTCIRSGHRLATCRSQRPVPRHRDPRGSGGQRISRTRGNLESFGAE